MLDGLIGRVQNTQLAGKDVEAEQRIQQALGSNPDALYVLCQTVLVQGYALEQATQQLAASKTAAVAGTGERGQSPRLSGKNLRQLTAHPRTTCTCNAGELWRPGVQHARVSAIRVRAAGLPPAVSLAGLREPHGRRWLWWRRLWWRRLLAGRVADRSRCCHGRDCGAESGRADARLWPRGGLRVGPRNGQLRRWQGLHRQLRLRGRPGQWRLVRRSACQLRWRERRPERATSKTGVATGEDSWVATIPAETAVTPLQMTAAIQETRSRTTLTTAATAAAVTTTATEPAMRPVRSRGSRAESGCCPGSHRPAAA